MQQFKKCIMFEVVPGWDMWLSGSLIESHYTWLDSFEIRPV